MKKSTFVPAVMLLWCASLSAQSVLSARSPIGNPFEHETGPSAALGGSGVGVANDFFGMADNPGNLGSMNRSVFSLLASADILHIKENGSISRMGVLSPRLFSFAVPFGAAGVFGFSLDRRSDAQYRFRTMSSALVPLIGYDTTDFGIVKNGGISAWQAGWGHTLGRHLRIGFCYERVYLSTIEITMMRTSFSGTDGAFSAALYDTTAVQFRGNGIRAGVLLPLKKITVGLSGEYLFSGTAENELSKDSPLGSVRSKSDFALHLPPSLSAGISYTPSPEWLIAGSGSVTVWENYHSGLKLGAPTGDNRFSFSAGVQFIPAPNLLVPKYWEIVQYRAGFRFAQLPAPGASETAVSLSLGLPMQQAGGLIDLIAKFGRRSDTHSPGYSEDFYQFMIGFNGGRAWFRNTGSRY